MLLGFAGVVGMGAGIFAANIGVNTTNGGQIEFGTGTAVISTCVDRAELNLVTSFDSSDSKFYLDAVSVSIYDVEEPNCVNGSQMTVNVMTTAGANLNVFATPTVTLSDGPFTITDDVTFPSDVIDSDDIGYILLETSN